MKVLSFTHFLQGPLAAQLLGDFGADVIKVEPLNGAFERRWSGHNAYLNGVSLNYLLGNRNNRSISVDLKSEVGRQIALRMAEQADVIIENYRPGVMKRLGLDYDSLKSRNPRLIYCSCSGYGEDGPYVHLPGQDLLAQAKSGLMTLSGGATDPPMALGAPVVDIHASVLAASAILAAFYAREETGRGIRIESNLLDAALDLQIEPLNIYLNGFELYPRSPSGISSRFGQAPYGVFRTLDGYLCLSMVSLELLEKVFEDPSFLQWRPSDQFEHREEINQLVAEHMRQKESSYWEKRFQGFGIWYSPICTYDDVEQNPQVQWNQLFVSVEHPMAGPVRLINNPIRFSDREGQEIKPPPEIGQHTTEILLELGYRAEEVRQLLQSSVIKQAELKREAAY